MIGFAALLAVTAEAARNEAMLGVAVATGHGGVLAREILQGLWGSTVAVGAQIRFYARQVEGGMGVGVAVVTGLGLILVAMGVAVAIDTFGEGISVFDLARGIGVIDLVTEGALLLVPLSGGLQGFEHPYVALGALLHGQWLHRLVKERWARRNLLDLVGQVDLAGFGLGGGAAQDDHCPGNKATDAQVST